MAVSSSDKIRLTYVEETALGVSGGGNLTEFRKNTESMDGAPKIIESDEVTGDGEPTGQLIVGLDAKGGTVSQLAPTISHQDFIRAGMRSTWGGSINTGAETLAIDVTAKTITRSAGDFLADGFKAGDTAILSGYTAATNNTIVRILSLTTTVVTYAGAGDMVDEAGSGDEILTRPEYVDWGSTDTSFTLAKDFLDLTDKSLTYPGMRVASFKLDFNYGAICQVAFEMLGTDYAIPAVPFTDGKTIDSVGVEEALNASSDVGVVIIDGVETDYCIESLGVDISNNMQAVECVGHLAPADQVATGLSVGVTVEMFLGDSNFDFHQKKLQQTPIAISYYVKDENGAGYAVDVAAVQLSFSDANSGGKRQLSKLSLSGVAKRDTVLGRTIRISKLS